MNKNGNWLGYCFRKLIWNLFPGLRVTEERRNESFKNENGWSGIVDSSPFSYWYIIDGEWKAFKTPFVKFFTPTVGSPMAFSSDIPILPPPSVEVKTERPYIVTQNVYGSLIFALVHIDTDKGRFVQKISVPMIVWQEDGETKNRMILAAADMARKRGAVPVIPELPISKSNK